MSSIDTSTNQIIFSQEQIKHEVINHRLLSLSITTPNVFNVSEYASFLLKNKYKTTNYKDLSLYYSYNLDTKLWNKIDISAFANAIFDIYLIPRYKAHIKDSRQFHDILRKCLEIKFRRAVSHTVAGKLFDETFLTKLNPLGPWIPTNNGKLVNIFTLGQRERTLDDFYTHTINANPDDMSISKCSEVCAFFCKLMCNDSELTTLILQLLAVYISGDVSDHTWAIFYTPKCSSGISTLLSLLQILLGDFAISLNILDSYFKSGNLRKRLRLTFVDNEDTLSDLTDAHICGMTNSGSFPREDNENNHFIISSMLLPNNTLSQASKSKTIVIPFNAEFVNKYTIADESVSSNEFLANPNMLKILSTPDNLNRLFYLLIQSGHRYHKNGYKFNIPEKCRLH